MDIWLVIHAERKALADDVRGLSGDATDPQSCIWRTR